MSQLVVVHLIPLWSEEGESIHGGLFDSSVVVRTEFIRGGSLDSSVT